MLNQLERAVLHRFCESEGFKISNVDLIQVRVTDRDFNGAGFMTWLEPNQLSVANAPKSFTGGKIGAKINDSIDAGFVVYIKEGCVNALEGYTYGEEWPEEVKKFELYVNESSSEHKK